MLVKFHKGTDLTLFWFFDY